MGTLCKISIKDDINLSNDQKKTICDLLLKIKFDLFLIENSENENLNKLIGYKTFFNEKNVILSTIKYQYLVRDNGKIAAQKESSFLGGVVKQNEDYNKNFIAPLLAILDNKTKGVFFEEKSLKIFKSDSEDNFLTYSVNETGKTIQEKNNSKDMELFVKI